MYRRILEATQYAAIKASGKSIKDSDAFIKDFINSANFYGQEDSNIEVYVLEVTQTLLQDVSVRFMENDFERGHRRLRRFMRAVDSCAPKHVRLIVAHFVESMQAFGLFCAKNWAEAIRVINPLISQCPSKGKYYASGLSDLLIMLSECYSFLMQFDDALLSARLAVSTSHERSDLMSTQQVNNQLPPLTEASKSTSTWDISPNVHGSRLPLWITFDVSVVLNSKIAVCMAYFNLASQLEKNYMGHLSVEWYDRSLQLALRLQLPDGIVSEMRESMAISRVHLPQLMHSSSSNNINTSNVNTNSTSQNAISMNNNKISMATIDNDSQLTFEYELVNANEQRGMPTNVMYIDTNHDMLDPASYYDSQSPLTSLAQIQWPNRSEKAMSSNLSQVSEKSGNSRPKSAYPRLSSPTKDVTTDGVDGNNVDTDRGTDDEVSHISGHSTRLNRPKSAHSKLGEHYFHAQSEPGMLYVNDNYNNPYVGGGFPLNQYGPSTQWMSSISPTANWSSQGKSQNHGRVFFNEYPNDGMMNNGGGYGFGVNNSSTNFINANNGFEENTYGNYGNNNNNTYGYNSNNATNFNRINNSNRSNTNTPTNRAQNTRKISGNSLGSSMTTMQRKVEAIIKLQSEARKYIAKKRVQSIRKQKAFQKLRFKQKIAIVIIQKYVRRFVVRCKFVRRLKLLRNRLNSGSRSFILSDLNSSVIVRSESLTTLENGKHKSKTKNSNNVAKGVINRKKNALRSTATVSDSMDYDTSVNDSEVNPSLIHKLESELNRTLEIKFNKLKKELSAAKGIGGKDMRKSKSEARIGKVSTSLRISTDKQLVESLQMSPQPLRPPQLPLSPQQQQHYGLVGSPISKNITAPRKSYKAIPSYDSSIDKSIDPFVDNFLIRQSTSYKYRDEQLQREQCLVPNGMGIFPKGSKVLAPCLREYFARNKAPMIPAKIMSSQRVYREIEVDAASESKNRKKNESESTTMRVSQTVYKVIFDHGVNEDLIDAYCLQTVEDFQVSKQPLLKPQSQMVLHSSATNFPNYALIFGTFRKEKLFGSAQAMKKLTGYEKRCTNDEDMKLSVTNVLYRTRQRMESIRLKASRLRNESALKVQKLMRGFLTRQRIRNWNDNKKKMVYLREKEIELLTKEKLINEKYSQFVENAISETKKRIFLENVTTADVMRQNNHLNSIDTMSDLSVHSRHNSFVGPPSSDGRLGVKSSEYDYIRDNLLLETKRDGEKVGMHLPISEGQYKGSVQFSEQVARNNGSNEGLRRNEPINSSVMGPLVGIADNLGSLPTSAQSNPSHSNSNSRVMNTTQGGPSPSLSGVAVVTPLGFDRHDTRLLPLPSSSGNAGRLILEDMEETLIVQPVIDNTETKVNEMFGAIRTTEADNFGVTEGLANDLLNDIHSTKDNQDDFGPLSAVNTTNAVNHYGEDDQGLYEENAISAMEDVRGESAVQDIIYDNQLDVLQALADAPNSHVTNKVVVEAFVDHGHQNHHEPNGQDEHEDIGDDLNAHNSTLIIESSAIVESVFVDDSFVKKHCPSLNDGSLGVFDSDDNVIDTTNAINQAGDVGTYSPRLLSLLQTLDSCLSIASGGSQDNENTDLYSVCRTDGAKAEKVRQSLGEVPKVFRISLAMSCAQEFSVTLTSKNNTETTFAISDTLDIQNEYRRVAAWAIDSEIDLLQAIQQYCGVHHEELTAQYESVRGRLNLANVVINDHMARILMEQSKSLGNLLSPVTFEFVTEDENQETTQPSTVVIRCQDLLSFVDNDSWTTLELPPRLSMDLRAGIVSIGGVVCSLLSLADHMLNWSNHRVRNHAATMQMITELVIKMRSEIHGQSSDVSTAVTPTKTSFVTSQGDLNVEYLLTHLLQIIRSGRDLHKSHLDELSRLQSQVTKFLVNWEFDIRKQLIDVNQESSDYSQQSSFATEVYFVNETQKISEFIVSDILNELYKDRAVVNREGYCRETASEIFVDAEQISKKYNFLFHTLFKDVMTSMHLQNDSSFHDLENRFETTISFIIENSFDSLNDVDFFSSTLPSLKMSQYLQSQNFDIMNELAMHSTHHEFMNRLQTIPNDLDSPGHVSNKTTTPSYCMETLTAICEHIMYSKGNDNNNSNNNGDMITQQEKDMLGYLSRGILVVVDTLTCLEL